MKIFLFLLLSSHVFSTYPLDVKMANGIALGVGAVVGVGAGVATYFAIKDNENPDKPNTVKNKLKSIALSVLSGSVIGVGSGFIARMILSGFILKDPIKEMRDQISHAQNTMRYMGKNPIVEKNLNGDDETIAAVRRHYVTHDFWLSEAHIDLSRSLERARGVISTADSILKNAANNGELTAASNALRLDAQQAVDRLTAALLVISNHAEYQQQRDAHRRLERENQNQQMLQQNYTARNNLANAARFRRGNFNIFAQI